MLAVILTGYLLVLLVVSILMAALPQIDADLEFSPAELSWAQNAYGALAGIGTAVGLIAGGVLTSALSWRYGFLLNVPVGLAAIVAAPRLLEETEPTPPAWTSGAHCVRRSARARSCSGSCTPPMPAGRPRRPSWRWRAAWR